MEWSYVGAGIRDRTEDLLITSQMLYQLSYAGPGENKMERETRIELATNSLEGCDSTIELLPHFQLIV
jgi:hypothetical protein